MSSIDVIIVNWNSGRQLFESLKSLELAATQGNNIVHVVVIDNASSDDSLRDIDGIDLPLTVIRNKDNRGFATACNQGAMRSQSDYILFLNPDTILRPDSIDIPIKFMTATENEDVGIVGIQLVNERECVTRTCARFPTAGVFFTKMLGLDRIFSVFFPSILMNEWDHSSNREVDHVIGAFYIIRRSLFVSLGGFDEQFFVYLEDLDLSYRARQTGWKCFYLADAQAFHKGGGASEQIKATRLFYSLRSQVQYGFKHFSFISAASLMVGTLSLEFIARMGLAIIHVSVREVKETVQAYDLLYRSIPSFIKGRLR